MPRYDFCHTVTDEKLGGIAIAYDIEVEVELSVEWDGGEPIVSVDGVFKDGQNLFLGSSLARLIAAEIADAAEDDSDLIARAIADEGFVYRGLGGLDPDGHFIRRAF